MPAEKPVRAPAPSADQIEHRMGKLAVDIHHRLRSVAIVPEIETAFQDRPRTPSIG